MMSVRQRMRFMRRYSSIHLRLLCNPSRTSGSECSASAEPIFPMNSYYKCGPKNLSVSFSRAKTVLACGEHDKRLREWLRESEESCPGLYIGMSNCLLAGFSWNYT